MELNYFEGVQNMKKTIDDLKLKGKKVLLRVDFNVPIKDNIIQSDKRIKAAIPTIKKIIDEGGKVILFSHLGRIKTKEDKIKNNLKIVSEALSKLINKKVKFINKTRGRLLEEAIKQMKEKEIIMVQNTRYEDLNDNAESKNNQELGQYWASLGDIFINDAFGTSHRVHASNVGISNNIASSAIGYLVQEELYMFSKALKKPIRPFMAIVGGAKVSDKILVIENLLKKADKVLIGGGMAYTFLKAMGYEIGSSMVEKEYINFAKKVLKKGKEKIVLPIDHAISSSFANNKRKITIGINIPKDFMGLDIGDKSIKIYQKILKKGKTIVWNGPMGVAEFDNFKKGTMSIAKIISKKKGVFSIIGGGDSASIAINLGFENKFTHISTGGGASLQYIEGKLLPGIEAIQNI